jgi:hypothetical protein
VIHLPQSQDQISAEIKAHQIRQDNKKAAIAELASTRQEELRAMMATQMLMVRSDVDPMSIFEGEGLNVNLDLDNNNKAVGEPSRAKTPMDEIIDVGSTNVKDVASCHQHPLSSPPPNTNLKSQSVDPGGSPPTVAPITARKAPVQHVKPPRVIPAMSKHVAKV